MINPKVEHYIFTIISWVIRPYRRLKHLGWCPERYLTERGPIRVCHYCFRMRFPSREARRKFNAIVEGRKKLKVDVSHDSPR